MGSTISLNHRHFKRLVATDGFAAALQAALDDDAAYGEVAVPAGGWSLERDVWWDRNRVTIRGAGRDRTTIRTGPASGLLMVPRAPTGLPLAAGHRVDLYGKLDASAAPAPGVRWGLRTRDPVSGALAHPSFTDTPFSGGKAIGGATGYPDFWRTLDQITIDFAFDAPDGTIPEGPLWGAAERTGTLMHGAPFHLTYHPDVGPFRLFFSTVTAGGAVDYRYVPFAPAGAVVPGVQRGSIQVDLRNAAVQAYYAGLQVATSFPWGNPNWTAATGLRFRAPGYVPWNFGAIAPAGVFGGGGDVFGMPGLDRTICGFRLTEGPLYADDGAGQPQRRIDGLALDDAARFFRGDPGTICYLPLTDAPGPDRRVSLAIGPAGGDVNPVYAPRGLWLSEAHTGSGGLASVVRGCALRDLTLDGSGVPWGSPFTALTAWELELENVTILGGYRGVNWLIGGINSYPVQARNLRCGGYDAGYFGNFQELHLEGVTQFLGPGRAAMRMVRSEVVAKGKVFVSEPQPWCEYLFRCHSQGDGSKLDLGALEHDAEANAAPTVALIGVDTEGSIFRDRVMLRDSQIGKLGPDASVVRLEAYGPGRPGRVEVSNTLFVSAGFRSVVRVIDATTTPWGGEVAHCDRPDPAIPWVEHDHPESEGSVVVVE